METNKGFSPEVIATYKQKIGTNSHLVVDSEDNSDEYVNFMFIGDYEGKEVLYDAVIYTLRLHHNSELYDIAEHKAAAHFPEYKQINYEEDENGDLEILDDLEEEIGLYMAEVIMDLEEEGEVKVKEHIEIDPNIDFGVGLECGLNIDKVTPQIINKFVQEFNTGSVSLDKTLYTFQNSTEEEDF